MMPEMSGAAPSLPLFSAHAEAKVAEALNVVMFAHGGGDEPIRDEQLATLRMSLTGLVDCLFPINGDYADFGGVDSLDGIDYVHPTRVAALSAVIGRTLSMRRTELIGLALAAALMNVGYLALRRSLLDEPRRLLEGEWEEHVHTHPVRGVALLAESGLPDDSLRAVAEHHERWDGSGYPAGLRGEAISRHARILAVADTYVSLRSIRPHRPPVDAERALEEIASDRGRLFDPEVVDAFEDVIADFTGIMRASRTAAAATANAAVSTEESVASQRDGAATADAEVLSTSDAAIDIGDGEERLAVFRPRKARNQPHRKDKPPAGVQVIAPVQPRPSPADAAAWPTRMSSAETPPVAPRRVRLRRPARRPYHHRRGLYATMLYVDAAVCGRWPVDRQTR